MARFLIERTFPGGLAVAANEAGARAWQQVVEANDSAGVTWLHSYVYAGSAPAAPTARAPSASGD